MKGTMIVFFLAVLVALTGFCGFLFGVMLSAEDRISLILVVLFAFGMLLTNWAVSSYVGVKKKIFIPSLPFFSSCVLGGLMYDWLVLPEGFKLIGLTVVLAVAGWFMVVRIKSAFSAL